MHCSGTRLTQRGGLGLQVVGPAGGQHHGRPGGQPQRHFHSDLAAPTKDDQRARGPIRVLHGADYYLR